MSFGAGYNWDHRQPRPPRRRPRSFLSRLRFSFSQFWAALRYGQDKLAEPYERRHKEQVETILAAEARMAGVHRFYKAWCDEQGAEWADGVDPETYSKPLHEFSEYLGYPQGWRSNVFPEIEDRWKELQAR